MSTNSKSGEQVRRQVMGDAFVDRALGNASEFTQPLQDFVNEHAWGGVWTRGVLERKTRSLITLSALTVAVGRVVRGGRVGVWVDTRCVGGSNGMSLSPCWAMRRWQSAHLRQLSFSTSSPPMWTYS